MKEIKVNKIDLRPLIDMLIKVYDSGADYVDFVVGQQKPNQDFLGILVREEYLNFEREEEQKEKKLTAEDINQLLEL
jgi:hypothetical protein